MKLVDLLSGVLVGDECWPVGAEGVVQDDDGCLWFFNGGTPEWHERIWCPESESSTFRWVDWDYSAPKSTDNSISIVTREQYETALAAKNDGWINWHGGNCPVDKGVLVDVRYRDMSETDGDSAGQLYWGFDNETDDIIAYRLHKPEVKSAEWNGEGLPPIGAECVVTPHNSLWGFSSVDNYTGKVLAYDGEDFWFVMLGGVKVASRTDKVDFSLPRTESESKIAKAKFQIAELCRKSSSNGHSADLIYNAIADGKIEGVKLEGN